MIRNLAFATASAMLVAAPVVAQAAPARAPAPVAGESEELAGGIIVPLLAAAALAALTAFVTIDDDDEVPTSP